MIKNSSVLKLAIFIGLFAVILSVPIIRFLSFAFTPCNRGSTQSAPYYVEIHKGDYPAEITKQLVQLQVIHEPKSFIWLGKLTRQWGRIKAGEYEISAQMTPFEILNKFASGISVIHPVTVKEGENIYEIAKDLAAKKLIKQEHDFIELSHNESFIKSLEYFKGDAPKTLEGYFFPETYFFNKTQTPQDIAKQMVRHFFEYWKEPQNQRAKELQLTMHQVVTLASMIEKETGAAEERPLISSVFHNRLKQGMRLQSDPTTIYGMWTRYTGNIHKADLLEKNEYNTYQISGLPIGPISNPGKASLDAALHPLQSSYLYFVSHNDGTHQFSIQYSDHIRAVNQFQIKPQNQIGQNWKNMNRKKTLIHQ